MIPFGNEADSDRNYRDFIRSLGNMPGWMTQRL